MSVELLERKALESHEPTGNPFAEDTRVFHQPVGLKQPNKIYSQAPKFWCLFF